MFKNYLLIALRVVLKNRVFSLINVLGLSTGIACCILITLYIQDELSFEKGFNDYQKVFRINTTFITDGKEETSPLASPPIAAGLADVLPDVETYTRVMAPFNTEVNIVTHRDRSFFERNAYFVDSTFLDVFQYKLAEGNVATALDAPASVLISENLATKIFGGKSALDEPLIISSGTQTDTFRVTGVVAKPGFPSHVDADIYMSMNSPGWGRWVLTETTWADNNIVGSYLKLRDPENYKSVESKIPPILEEHAGEALRQFGRKKILTLEQIGDIRLQSKMYYVYMIATIGTMILLLACINFMNLTTARSAQRAGEVGIRKSMGAQRTNLIRQFLGESMVIVFFALVVAAVMVVIALPTFNSIMEKSLELTSRNLPFIVGAGLLIAIATALLAGSYPAFFLSAMRPVQVLKGKVGPIGSQLLRKGLIVFQFVITITLISGIIIIQKQLSFVQSKTLGFDASQLVMIPMRTPQAAAQYASLKNEFTTIKGVEKISATTSVPSTPLSTDWLIFKDGQTAEQSTAHDILRIDAEYFDAMNIELIAGRDFIVGQDNVPGDTINRAKAIVNESSLRSLGIPLSEAVGTTIYFQPEQERVPFVVVGVVKDFHQFSLHREIRPMMFILSGTRRYFSYIAALVDMNEWRSISESMQKIWDGRVHTAPFESIFVNENLKNQYAAERRTSTMLSICTVIAMIISCLGLYGLSVYIAERRTKEIGIRKVVGASISGIVGMLSRDYIRLLLISFVLSVPLGYYFAERWLDAFAYRITPDVWIFILSGLISFTVAWLTVSFESIKAARRNPVDTLRRE
ncbi:MAG TPA: ABC transporter permease [Cyclobacteriaceae bacterium]|nr:ABC transporter permease [Cyclobacteriaceae bacterium]